MSPGRFELHRPEGLDEALELRDRLGDDAALYAGGTELLMAMQMGLVSCGHLIDLKRIPALRGVEAVEGGVRIGATATHRDIELAPCVRERLPALAELERGVANVRVRAAGTLVGNLAFADPHADPAPLLVALGATVQLASVAGARTLPVEGLVLGAYETAVAGNEVITSVFVPHLDGRRAAYAAFRVLERPTVGIAVVGAVLDGAFAEPPAVVVGAVDEAPRRVWSTGVEGRSATDVATELGDAAAEAIDPVDDLSGSAEYKRHLTATLTRRVVIRLAEGT